MSIVILPAELIGEIAVLSGAVSIGNLWCCGSRLLNGKLASRYGMSTYELGNGIARIEEAPEFVHQLQGLKQIIIRSAPQQLLLPSDFFHQRFCKHVESISVCSDNPTRGWFKYVFFQLAWPPDVFVDFEAQFPVLTTLEFEYLNASEAELWPVSISSFPSTLTSLTINSPCIDELNLRDLSYLSNLRQLTLGVRDVDLTILAPLPHLEKLCLPSLVIVPKLAKLAALRHLEVPRASYLPAYTFSYFPHLERLSLPLDNPHLNWSPVQHRITYLRLGFPPLIYLKFSEIGRMLPMMISLTHLRLHKRCILNYKDVRSLPPSLTYLKGPLDAPHLAYLPTGLGHLSLLRLLNVIPIRKLPRTLKTVQSTEDLAINAKSVFPKWKGPQWVSIHSTFENDDCEIFQTIWSYMKPKKPDFIFMTANRAVQKRCPRIFKLVLSKDTFWSSLHQLRDSKYLIGDLMRMAPPESVVKFYRNGFKFAYIPDAVLESVLASEYLDALDVMFRQYQFSKKSARRNLLTLAIKVKNLKSARWLLDHQCYECDVDEIIELSITEQDASYLEMMTELGIGSPGSIYHRCLRTGHLPKLLPIDSLHLENLNIDFTIRFLDWMSFYDSKPAFSTIELIVNCYRTLPKNLVELAEPIFFKMFAWLLAHQYEIHEIPPRKGSKTLKTIHFAQTMNHKSIITQLSSTRNTTK